MKANEYNFEYIENGKGEPVVFVHGSVSDYRTWTGQIDKFGKHYKTITYSRRFHWPNVKISENEDYSMYQHVSDLEEILKMINTPVHLIGHSYGAFICLLLALKSPQMIRTLVLEEPPVITMFVSNTPKLFEILKLFFTRPKTAIALVKLGATGIEPATKEVKRDQLEKAIEIFGKATLGENTFSNLSDSRMEQVHQNMIKAEFIGSGFPPIEQSKIREIEIPTLLITGENSPKIFGLLADRLVQLIPISQKKVIHEASHISHEDNALDFNQSVLSFYDEVRH